MDILTIILGIIVLIFGLGIIVWILKSGYLIIKTFTTVYYNTFQRIHTENFVYWLIVLPFRLTLWPLLLSIMVLYAGGDVEMNRSVKRLRIDTLKKRIAILKEEKSYASEANKHSIQQEIETKERELRQVING